jgi:hypothetical protein
MFLQFEKNKSTVVVALIRMMCRFISPDQHFHLCLLPGGAA